MKITIPYGDKDSTIDIPDHHRVVVLEPERLKRGEARQIIRQSLTEPHGQVSLDEFLGGGGRVLCVVNDATRPTPTAEILRCIDGHLAGRPVDFIVATGTHGPPTIEEMNRIFGDGLDAVRDRVSVHNCLDDERLYFAGRTSFGTDLHFNRVLSEYEKVLIITSVEPHYFAGYTGGRKSLNPGLAGRKTVVHNHCLALSNGAESCALDGNPVHLDMIESLGYLHNEIFAIQAVLDRDRAIYSVDAGALALSFEAAVARSDEVFRVETEGKFDIVISVATFPMDRDLYQAQKTIENGKLALKDGGILIFVSSCSNGAGPSGYMELMASAGSVEAILEKAAEGRIFGCHKAWKLAELMKRAEIWGVTGLPGELLSTIFIRPFSSVEDAVPAALQKKGREATVCVLMDGSHTVPMLGSRLPSKEGNETVRREVI